MYAQSPLWREGSTSGTKSGPATLPLWTSPGTLTTGVVCTMPPVTTGFEVITPVVLLRYTRAGLTISTSIGRPLRALTRLLISQPPNNPFVSALELDPNFFPVPNG